MKDNCPAEIHSSKKTHDGNKKWNTRGRTHKAEIQPFKFKRAVASCALRFLIGCVTRTRVAVRRFVINTTCVFLVFLFTKAAHSYSAQNHLEHGVDCQNSSLSNSFQLCLEWERPLQLWEKISLQLIFVSHTQKYRLAGLVILLFWKGPQRFCTLVFYGVEHLC